MESDVIYFKVCQILRKNEIIITRITLSMIKCYNSKYNSHLEPLLSSYKKKKEKKEITISSTLN